MPDPTLSLADGAIAPFKGAAARPRYYRALLNALAEHLDIDLDTPWRKLPAKARKALLHGTGTTS